MSHPHRLPVFALASAEANPEHTVCELARVISGAPLAGPQAEEEGSYLVHRSGSRILEVDRRSGQVYWQDRAALWNPRQLARVPGIHAARLVSDGCVRVLHRVLAKRSRHVEVVFSHATHTMTAAQGSASQARAVVGGSPVPEVAFAQSAPLDLQVFYRMQVLVPAGNGSFVPMPVTGGGGKYRVALGHGGRITGLSGGWRPILDVSREAPIKPRVHAESEFRQHFADLDVRNVRATLAYYAAPSFERQTELAPVWEVSGQVWAEGQRFDIRTHWIAAIEGEFTGAPVAGSDADMFPAAASGEAAGPAALAVPTAVARSSAAAVAAGAATWPSRSPRKLAARQCAAAWLGQKGGTLQKNKDGFLEGCRALGFDVSFDLGNTSAHESLFNSQSAQFADAVQLMFYTGHANPDGWFMHPPDSSALVYDPPVGGPLRFGQHSLEWLIIAACGPLQSSHFRAGASNAFDRWGPTFAGLHGMLGYGSLSRAYSGEGRRVMELVGRGASMVEAWMRTALEVQPCSSAADIAAGRGIYPVAMYAHRGDHATRYEGLGSPASASASADDPARQLQMLWMEI